MKKAIILFAVLLLLISITPAVRAAESPEHPPEIVEETFTPLDDDTMDSMGYLTLQATAPEGFCGNIRIDLRKRSTGARKTVELTAWEEYYTGVWLPVGDYQVISGYIPDGEHFTVSWDPDEILISRDTDAALTITVASDGSTEAEISGKMETFSPPPESETVQAETTVETTRKPTEPQPEKPAVFSARRLLIDVLSAAIFAGVVFLGAYIARKHRENEES